MPSVFELFAVPIGCLVVFLFLKTSSKSNLPLPPGPKKIPFFGNLFQVPALRPYPIVRGPSYALDGLPEQITLNVVPGVGAEIRTNLSFAIGSPECNRSEYTGSRRRVVR